MKEIALVCVIVGIMACGKEAANPGVVEDAAALSQPAPTGSSCEVSVTEHGTFVQCAGWDEFVFIPAKDDDCNCNKGKKHKCD